MNESILNDGEITKSDSRNEMARNHVGHKLVKVGLERHVKNKVPYLKTRVQKYLCEDCKTLFEAFNTVEDDKKKQDNLKDVFRED